MLTNPTKYLESVLKQKGYSNATHPGIAVSVTHNGKSLVHYGVGYANMELKQKIDGNAGFDLASCSKHFTAAAILMLHCQGKVDIEASAKNYIPELVHDSVKIHHLIHHTAGLVDYLQFDDIYNKDDVIRAIADKPLEFEPNEKHEYSNSAYVVLGVIIERVSGKSYRDFMMDEIFVPLGMTNTDVIDSKTSSVLGAGTDNVWIKNRAIGYKRQGKKSSGNKMNFIVDLSDMDVNGDGGIVTCLVDFEKWDSELWNKLAKLGVDEETFDKYFYYAGYSDEGYHGYGFGVVDVCDGDESDIVDAEWTEDEQDLPNCVVHDGSWSGTSTQFMRHLKHKVTVTVLSNIVENDDVDAVCRQVMNKVLQEIK
jgi:CubicO group peptidase (beta-lactamase class C family)